MDAAPGVVAVEGWGLDRLVDAGIGGWAVVGLAAGGGGWAAAHAADGWTAEATQKVVVSFLWRVVAACLW